MDRPEAVAVIHTLEGGTDAGSMLIFDPSALPDDYDARMRHDPVAAIQRLHGDGRLYWLDTASDGGFSLGVCIARCLSDQLAEFAKPLGGAPQFDAASGRLYFTGIEYAFRHDDSFLRKHPHMGACYPVAPGIYRLTVYEMAYPEDFREDILRGRLPRGDFRLYSLMDRLIPLALLSAIALIVSPFLLGWRLWSSTALPVCVALALPAIMISRARSYREARQALSAIEHEFPDFCATLVTGTNQPESDQNAVF
jgi:hypothetical protein